jgi:hypothetical protein
METETTDQNTDEQNAKKRDRLRALAESLLKKRDDAVIFRASSGIERQWREDEKTFNSLTEDQKTAMMDYATGQAPVKAGSGPARSKVVVNVLRARCETAEGRFSDILLPVDDKNWGMKPTPVPMLVKGMKDDRPVINTETGETIPGENGQPIKASDVARAKMESAKDAMGGMENVIDDQLNECSFNGECRKMVHDAVPMGCGVIKGPNVIKQIRKSWVKQEDQTGTTYVMERSEDPRPMSKRVDYWNVYPDPNCGEEIKRASYIWDYDEILPRELRSLDGLPGYFSDEITAILAEDPKRTQAVYNKNEKRNEVKAGYATKGSSYEKWEYHGDVDRDDLEALGCSCEDLQGRSLSACVVFVNDRPIKVQLNVLDSGDLPYDFFQWCQIKGSPWGIGIIRIGTWAQRVIQAAWRAMMDNGRDSSGANIIIGKGIEPVDGRLEITGKKLWRATGDIDDVRKAFVQFQIENRQVELQAIIDMALRFLDMETSLPMMFQGEKGEMPETLGATNIMVDSNNVALRSRVKRWDDQITRPHISRYYYWNMQYNENSDIKGDYSVDARGTSVLLVRDQQAVAITNLMALRGDPRVDKEVDWGKAVRELFTSLKLNVLKSEEDKKKEEADRANQPQQPGDPRIQSAQIRVQGEMQKAELVQASDIAEINAKIADAQADRQHEMALKQMDLQIKQMEFAQQSGLSLQQIKADLAKEASKQNLMRELTDKKMATPQLTNPPIEPAQKAAPGRAFQE